GRWGSGGRPRQQPQPLTGDVWLAVERNYLCARSLGFTGEGDQAVPFHEAHAKEWTEAAPGVWLPRQFDVTYYRRRNGKKSDVWRRSRLIVDKAVVNADSADRFTELEGPEGLPISKIDREAFLY